MINKFEKQLEKWNNGVLRGAQAKLAKILHVSSATVALWATGKRKPSKGYTEKMSQLFGMDIYSVMRLFSPLPTTYPEYKIPSTALRDGHGFSSAYNTDNFITDAETGIRQSNNISLPCFTAFPAQYPLFTETDVLEWWTLPRRGAKGAKFLIAFEQGIYFIKPCAQWQEGTTMLFQEGSRFWIGKIQTEEDRLIYISPSGKKQFFSLPKLTPLGIAVRKIEELN